MKFKKMDLTQEEINNEIWKDHPDFIGFSFSNMGRIKYRDKISERKTDNGNIRIKSKNKNRKSCLHIIIAEIFIEKKEGRLKHIDGNKLNNRVSNLKWDIFRGHNKKDIIEEDLPDEIWKEHPDFENYL